jgi:hypothetical protein
MSEVKPLRLNFKLYSKNWIKKIRISKQPIAAMVSDSGVAAYRRTDNLLCEASSVLTNRVNPDPETCGLLIH